MRDSKFPPSAQSDLFAMLTPEQRIETANVFRHLKKASQTELSYILMQYIEDAVIPEFQSEDLMLSAAFVFLTGYEMPDKAPWRIMPRQNEKPKTKQPRRLGDIISDIFPMYNNSNK